MMETHQGIPGNVEMISFEYTPHKLLTPPSMQRPFTSHPDQFITTAHFTDCDSFFMIIDLTKTECELYSVMVFNNIMILSSIRGLPDISSLVPAGPKYMVKWTAPLQHVQVVEVGQEISQKNDSVYQPSGNKRFSSANSQGQNGFLDNKPIL